MRRTIAMLAVGTLFLALFVPAAFAADCASIFSGTNGPDTLEGDRCDNNISGLRGNDAIYGKGGNDTLYGNQDDDRLFGGRGSDELRGGSGNDRIFSGGLDGRRDLVFCGSGRDFASIAGNDRAADDCEVVAVAIE